MRIHARQHIPCHSIDKRYVNSSRNALQYEAGSKWNIKKVIVIRLFLVAALPNSTTLGPIPNGVGFSWSFSLHPTPANRIHHTCLLITVSCPEPRGLHGLNGTSKSLRYRSHAPIDLCSVLLNVVREVAGDPRGFVKHTNDSQDTVTRGGVTDVYLKIPGFIAGCKIIFPGDICVKSQKCSNHENCQVKLGERKRYRIQATRNSIALSTFMKAQLGSEFSIDLLASRTVRV